MLYKHLIFGDTKIGRKGSRTTTEMIGHPAVIIQKLIPSVVFVNFEQLNLLWWPEKQRMLQYTILTDRSVAELSIK